MTTQQFAIKPTEMQHIEGLRTCLDVVARERRYIGFLEAPPREMTESFVNANIRDGAPQFVALDGSNVVGWCDILIRPREGFRHVGTLGMGVLPKYRGQGIGTQLMQAALKGAWERGLTRVELDVFESNLPARRLYEKMGFQTEGVKRNARFLDGKYENVLVMAKLKDEDPSSVAD